jgi:hypothetical protein
MAFISFSSASLKRVMQKLLKSVLVKLSFLFVPLVRICKSHKIANIKNIFLLPNVELRILPATGSGGLINIHCIFNPDTTFLAKLENDFFASLEDSINIVNKFFNFFIIIYAEIVRYTNGFYIFLKCFFEKSNAKAIKISAEYYLLLAVVA